LISARSFGRPRRLVGIHVGDFASATRRVEDTRTAGLAAARLEHYSGLGTGHPRTRGRNRSMEGHSADPAQVRKATHHVFDFIHNLSIYQSIYLFFRSAQKCPWAGALLDLCAASAECNRTDYAVVCTHQGRSGRETDDAGQAYGDGEPGGGSGDADSDRACGEPFDSCQGAVRGA
jgi:hypothetical protein